MATALRENSQMTEAEWEARQQLAACYRVFDHLGWSEMIYNHITLKIPGEEGAFLINPFGLHFSEVKASSLVKIDIDGNKLDDSPLSGQPRRLRPARAVPPPSARRALHRAYSHHGGHGGRSRSRAACARPISMPAASPARSPITTSRA
jgi:hypothetical protein